ncbi:MAG: hypothetical protein KTR31_03405 [Myxococcales bacterium]|nr:hypothetical protein [Myxococcales bacterium]
MVRWLAVTALIAGCGDIIPSGGEPEDTCDLSLDALTDRSFVMLEATPSGDRRNPIARVKFVEKDGQMVAKYNVASPTDIYEMPCTLKEKDGNRELVCASEAKVKEWCQSLLVADAVCSKKVLKKFGATQSDEDLNEAIKAAKQEVKKYRGGDYWEQFALMNNSLGNKLQGRLYVKVNEKRCQLSVGDYYWTIHNGRGVEDTNPVGQNAFVEAEHEYLFEHCDEVNVMPGVEKQEDLTAQEIAQIPGQGRTYISKKDYWYHYLGEKHLKAEEGCTYSYDVWSNWKPLSQNNPMEVVKGRVPWKVQHAFTDEVALMGSPKPIGVVGIERYKECDGKKESLGIVCEAGLLQYE